MGIVSKRPDFAIRTFLNWLPVAIAATGCTLLAYVAMQQAIRQGADQPQVAMAEDAAAAMTRGDAVFDPHAAKIDIASSLSPFIATYDISGDPIGSDGQLGGAQPVPPEGVLDAATAEGENRVTWQPRKDVRIAAVVVAVSGIHAGYVLVGRSLRENERVIGAIGDDMALGLAAVLLASFAASYYAARRQAA